jgi:purine-binding chemotaxis protein CheW
VQTEAESVFLDDGQCNLATFEVRGRPYALDVSQVREIVHVQEITPLPLAPELIEGVIDLRGAVVPVIDLGRLLGGDPCETGSRSRIALLDLDGMVLGLMVEAATDVLSLRSADLEDVPDLASHAGYDAVRHVVRRSGEPPVMVLSLEHIVENVYRSALSERQPALHGEVQ